MADNKYFILTIDKIHEIYNAGIAEGGKRAYHSEMGNDDYAFKDVLTDKHLALPAPVEVPSDEEIIKEFPLMSPIQQIDTMHNREQSGKIYGAKWLRDLIFNLPNPSNK